MNKTISFGVKNQDGSISQIRILKIQPSGACYIDYEKKNNHFHFSLHTPNENNSSGQMHIKVDGNIVFKRIVPEFHNFNMHRCSESIFIPETELMKPSAKMSNTVKWLEVPRNHIIHIMLVRSDKAWGNINAAFFSDKPNAQSGEETIPYPVFYSIEDMPNANYYLTYRAFPIDNDFLELIDKIKEDYAQSGSMEKKDEHTFHVRLPFLSTDLEMFMTSDDIAKYLKS